MYDAVSSAPVVRSSPIRPDAGPDRPLDLPPPPTRLPAEALAPVLRAVVSDLGQSDLGQGSGAGSGIGAGASGGAGSTQKAPPASPAPPEPEPEPEPPRRDLDQVLRDYQVVDDEIVTYEAKVGPVRVAGPKEMTKTEADLLHDLQDERGLLGLKKFRDISSNDPDEPGLAFRTADEYYPPFDGNGAPVAGKEDGHNDAFRHAYWNALMTRHFGEEFATNVGNAHEGVPGNPADKEAMDLHNNELGRRIASENPDASDEELARLVFEAVQGGEAVVIDGQGDLAYSDQVAVGATGSADDPPATGTITPPNDADVTSG